MTSEKSLRLSDCLVFAANHSLAIQQSHYVSKEALEALAYYQNIAGDNDYYNDNDPGYDDNPGDVNAEYQLREDLAAVDGRKWQQALQREQKRDEHEKVRLDRFVRQKVRFNVISLIRGPGAELTRSLCQPVAFGTDVLHLGQEAKPQCFNLQGRSLLLAMLDWAPSRPESQVLLEDLYLACSIC